MQFTQKELENFTRYKSLTRFLWSIDFNTIKEILDKIPIGESEELDNERKDLNSFFEYYKSVGGGDKYLEYRFISLE